MKSTALVPMREAIIAELERARLWQKRLHDPWCWAPWVCIMIELLVG